MQQFFISDDSFDSGLSSEQLHQCRSVLRYRDRDRFRVVNALGDAVIASLNSDNTLSIHEYLENSTSILPPITLCAALIRSEKLEWMIQKATESGVDRIVLFETSRCVMKIKPEDISKKLERYCKIAREAAEQSLRRTIPQVIGVKALADLDNFKSELNMVCYEQAKSSHIARLVSQKSVSLFIGPEGGISDDELDQLILSGFEAVTLGPRIYRAETAAIYALNCISALTEGQV